MNEKLIKLYKRNWDDLSRELNLIIQDEKYKQKPTNPLLLSVKDKNVYLNSDIKVLFLGQETNSWGNVFNGDIQKIIQKYNNFYHSCKALNSYGGYFWNGINRFISLMNSKFIDKSISYLWSNTVRIGAARKAENMPADYIYEIELKYFKVLEEELDILNPDVILFVSGPNYDKNIKAILDGVEFLNFNSNFKKRQLAKVQYKNFKNIYRTYHPKYLWRNNINAYFNAIINDIEIKY